ncbi:type VII secretion integral membrane protein EccD [Microbacterium horticulturae]|uniref:Type VII secretion integral membrane protein EccD n=1 Tax=Microbacterium horticulturae TaxID=3028316 RepID=A0ABY8BVS2_9MICO|nr:type VII secretion integral membrane protein EccD [Microbacterium sp. KACC 23027]WEG08264.1 type VII secretion integral membrane protein EccD [Microbacterium sp. KACC 23027]
MSQTVSAPRALVRISVLGEGRRLDIGIPAQLPLIELMPGFARNLGLLDATMTHAGYELRRADGRALDASSTAAAQGVLDGDVLTLARGGLVAQPRVYDDVVEAVIDATEDQHRPWTPQDGVRTALAASLTLLGVCAVVLLAAGPAVPIGALIAGIGAVLLVAVAVVVARLGQVGAGHGLGIAAGVFAAVAGYLAVVGTAGPWGLPLAAAGASALVVGGATAALMPERRETALGVIVAGAVIGVTGGLTALMPGAAVAVYALMAAIVATASNALPWLVLSSSRIRVISPHSDAEVFADPAPIDGEDVARRTATAARALLVSRLALGVCILIATPLVAASTPAGSGLCALAFIGTMFPARQVYARSHVMAIMTLSTVGLGLTGIVTALTQPALQSLLLIVVVAATVVTVTITLIAPATRMRMSRVADVAELVILASLLPVGVIAAGLA